jgi:NAD(P)H-nitrite reductase large subunit
MKNANQKIVVLGNSTAAVGCIEGIRENDGTSQIVLIAKEPEHAYPRPLISYLLGGEVDDSRMTYRPTDFYKRNRVEAHLGLEATGIDVEKREVLTTDGKRYAFDKLLIGVGGLPIVPPLKNANTTGVFTFTTYQDAREIKAYIKARKVETAIVVGGGLIGLKSAEALHKLGIKVHLVELADRILSITFDEEASRISREQLEKNGVSVRCGTTVDEIKVSGGVVSGVKLKDGTVLECGMVIFAIGVRPNLKIVQGTSIQTNKGIVVDEHMETSIKGIYAAGDVAEAADALYGGKRPIPIFPNAYRQGKVAGKNMAGEPMAFEGGMPMNSVDVLGLPTISVGITAPQDPEGYEMLSKKSDNPVSYRKIVLKDNRIVGVIFIGDIDRAGIFTGLVKNRVDASQFKDLLLTDDFGLISLPREYRKHMVSGEGVVL